MAILSKVSKPGHPKSHNSLKVSFSNVRGLRTNFLDCESFLLSQSPDILALCETNLDASIDTSHFAVNGYLPLIRKDSCTHMHGLGLFVRDSLPLAQDIALESSEHSYMCFRLALLNSTSYFFFLYRSPSSPSCAILDSVSINIDKALSAHPNANIFVFGDFNAHHSDWLTYSNGINVPGEYSYNFAISHDLVQVVNCPTRIPDGNTTASSLLDLFLTSDESICSVDVQPPLGRSDHVVVSVSLDFGTLCNKDSSFHHKVFDYSRADWDGFCDLLRDIPWNDIFKYGPSYAASEFSSWVQVGMDAHIPNRKY